jgi:single-strand DNA-binding protein
MASDKNQITLQGRLTKDPEVKDINERTKLMQLTIASNEYWPGKGEGEWNSKTNFFNVKQWLKKDQAVPEQFKKGAKVSIDAKLKQESYVNSRGENVTSLSIEAKTIDLELEKEKKTKQPAMKQADKEVELV